MVALDYYHQNELARGDRSYLGCPAAYIFKPNSDERADLDRSAFGQISLRGPALGPPVDLRS